MSHRLLLVDDDPTLLDSLRRMLHVRRPDWELICLDRCNTAWEFLQVSNFALLIVDIWMPGISGLELLERMRADRRHHDTPVVVLTGMAHQRLRQRALEIGATELINKPVDAEQLLPILDAVLEERSAPGGDACSAIPPGSIAPALDDKAPSPHAENRSP
jgi:DNA-binding response OmpR family regulator